MGKYIITPTLRTQSQQYTSSAKRPDDKRRPQSSYVQYVCENPKADYGR